MTVPLATALFSQWTLQFALLGLATGALTALVALSLVIVHRVSGVLNFAAAALGRDRGVRLLSRLRDDFGWPSPIAVTVGLVVGSPPRALDVRGHGGAAECVIAQSVDRNARAAELCRESHAPALEQSVEPTRLDTADPQPRPRRFHPHRRGSPDPHRHRPHSRVGAVGGLQQVALRSRDFGGVREPSRRRHRRLGTSPDRARQLSDRRLPVCARRHPVSADRHVECGDSVGHRAVRRSRPRSSAASRPSGPQSAPRSSSACCKASSRCSSPTSPTRGTSVPSR